MTPPVTRVLRSAVPLRPDVILGSLSRGRDFVTFRSDSAGTVWWATATAGPTLARFTTSAADGSVTLTAWGSGAPWAAERMTAILGVDDNLDTFDPSLLMASPFTAVREAWARWGPWIRTPATGSIAECAALAVLEQRVTGIESRRAWVQLVRTFGEPAPGPADAVPSGMYVPPSPEQWRLIPSWEWHRAGVDPGRAATVIGVMQRASSLPRLLDIEPSDARQRLQSLPGIGVWTSAEIAHRALGDSDAVSFGDYHLPENIVYALTGDEGGTDDDLARVLEPASGHRYRVQRLVERSGVIRPRKGPRITIADHRSI